MDRAKYLELDKIFHPHNVAVIGASQFGDIASLALLSTKIKDRVYFVNPKYSEIYGRKCYASILDIPDPVDYAIFGINAKFVPDVLADCIKKGVRAAHIYTSGFSETGLPEAIELERKVKRIAEGKIRLIGPNCFGIYCPESGLAIVPESLEQEGNVGVITQSGSVAESFSYFGKTKNLKFSKVISYGNAIDLDCTDFLEYLADDPQTKVIALYIEGSRDGERLKRALKYASAKKPIVAIKGGLTENGSRVATSHTAAMTGTPELWKSLFKQCGVIQVNSYDEMVNAVMAFSYLNLPAGNRVSILSNSGGFSVIQTDLCHAEGIEVPKFTDGTIKQLRQLVPLAGTIIGNPLDAWPVYYKIYEKEGNLADIIGILGADKNIDMLVVQFDQFRYIRRMRQSEAGEHTRTLTEVMLTGMQHVRDVIGKPVIACVVIDPFLEDDEDRECNLMMKNVFEQNNFPVYPSLDAGIKAVSKLFKYASMHVADK
ncbi:MAG: CoA-binding protein [Dehalococcoidia bacterium]|nr:CoA-binding protein [Dehalococcoidia bacterium]MDD5493275.1 CoA-binding protein [Dehalococcoidia bacterium]